MLFTRHQPHPDGPVIRVRLARAGDRVALETLLHERGGGVDLQAARLLRHDPRAQLVLCATAWDGERERVVGFASVPMTAGAGPELRVTDEEQAPGAATALRQAAAARIQPDSRVA